MIVLDTSVLSETFRPDANLQVLDFVAMTPSLAVTAISVFELLEGIGRLPVGKRRRQISDSVEGVLEEFAGRVLSYSSSSARIQAIQGESRRLDGRPISMEDGMIAAICNEHGATLATRNTRDFEGLGIDLFNPWEPVDNQP